MKQILITVLIIVLLCSVPSYASALTRPANSFSVKDERNLVVIKVKNGEASLYYNTAQWVKWAESHPDIPFTHTFDRKEKGGPYPIDTYGLKVKQVVLATVPELDFWRYDDESSSPIGFFLMEDGSLQWQIFDSMFAEYYEVGAEGVYTFTLTENYLPELKSIYLDTELEGKGDLTVYGADEAGGVYDLCAAVRYNDLLSRLWETILPDDEDYKVTVGLNPDGIAVVSLGYEEEGMTAYYDGRWFLSFRADMATPGMLTLDLVRADDAGSTGIDSPDFLRGTFWTQLSGDGLLQLYHADGNSLVEGYDLFEFTSYYMEANPEYGSFDYEIMEVAEDTLIEYLKSMLPEINQLMKQGYSILVSKDYTETEFGLVADVFLGTQHKEQFVREIFYGISFSGAIVKYDPVNDEWELLVDSPVDGSPLALG